MISVAKKIIALGTSVLSLLLAVPSRAADEPYEIHVILELTGSGAFIGNSERQSVELVEKVVNRTGGINGRKLHFVVQDNQSTPQVAVQLANEVLATHPAVVLASTLVGDCAAMAPLFKNGPVLYCFTPSFHPPAGGYAYSTDTSTRDLATAGMRYFRLRGLTRIAIVTSTDATGQDADRNLNDVALFPENKDRIKIVEDVHFNPTDVSVTAQMERIKAADPQVLIAWSTGTPIATVFRAVGEAGLDIPIATTAGNAIYRQMEQFKAFLPRQLYFFTSPWPIGGDPRVKMDPVHAERQREFYQVFKEAGIRPDQGSLAGWEPVMIVIGGLRKLGLDATGEQLQAYLQHLKGFTGVSGYYDYEKTPQRGLSVENAMVNRWDAAAQRFVPASQLGGVPLDQ